MSAKLKFSDESKKLIFEDISAKLKFSGDGKKMIFENRSAKLIFANESEKLIFDITIVTPSNNVFPFIFPFNFS